jgi:hypothetical protein
MGKAAAHGPASKRYSGLWVLGRALSYMYKQTSKPYVVSL